MLTPILLGLIFMAILVFGYASLSRRGKKVVTSEELLADKATLAQASLDLERAAVAAQTRAALRRKQGLAAPPPQRAATLTETVVVPPAETTPVSPTDTSPGAPVASPAKSSPPPHPLKSSVVEPWSLTLPGEK